MLKRERHAQARQTTCNTRLNGCVARDSACISQLMLRWIAWLHRPRKRDRPLQIVRAIEFCESLLQTKGGPRSTLAGQAGKPYGEGLCTDRAERPSVLAALISGPGGVS
jgi:hypothetical protein